MDYIKLLNTIDVTDLEHQLAKLLGYYIKFSVSIHTPRRGKETLCVESQELKQHTGVMQYVYKSVKVQNFGGNLNDDDSLYWMPLHFGFEYQRGSNGAEIWFGGLDLCSINSGYFENKFIPT